MYEFNRTIQCCLLGAFSVESTDSFQDSLISVIDGPTQNGTFLTLSYIRKESAKYFFILHRLVGICVKMRF